MTAGGMADADRRRVLLVRALEEDSDFSWPPEQEQAAALAALGADDDASVLRLRARQLCRGLSRAQRLWLQAGALPGVALLALFALALILGMSANYLGDGGQFHIIYNPVSLLLIWNLLAYLLLMLPAKWLWPARRESPPDEETAVEPSAEDVTDAVASTRTPWWLRRALPGLWQRYLRLRHGVHLRREQARQWRQLGQRYLALYRRSADALLFEQWRLILHILAVGLCLGAVLGLYLQGLFTEYHAIWRSTFISDENLIRQLVSLLLAPAAWLLDGRGVTMPEIQQLMSGAGAPGESWLHRLALMALLLVLLPRSVLAVRHWRRQQQLQQAWVLPLDEDYYQQRLQILRDTHLRAMREHLAAEIQQEIDEFSAGLAAWVRESLFEGRILPRLQGFRSDGGKVADLERDILAMTQEFEAELQAQSQERQAEFAHNLQNRLFAVIGRHCPALDMPDISAGVVAPARRMGDDLGNRVATDLGEAVSVVVTTTVTATVASISGGIGKSIGIAVVSHLLGTSGPIGLLIGAAIGLAGGGAAYWLGKDKLREQIKNWTIPGAVARISLREGKLRQTGDAMAAAVADDIQGQMAPMIDGLSRALFRQLPQQLEAMAGAPGEAG